MLGKDKMAIIRTRQFRILGVLALISTIVIFFIVKKDAKESIEKIISSTLKQKHGLQVLTSRNATIFVDDLGRVRIPPDNIIDSMKFRDLEELYHRYLESVQAPCTRQVHLGSFTDGGYDLCENSQVIPTKPCVVYSFGVRDDFSFDEELSKNYGCQVHSFDPANGMEDHEHSPNIYFHSMGLSDKDETNSKGWKMRTVNTIRKELGHTNSSIPVMKIDIEGGEWTALPQMLRTGTLAGVKQMIMEFHSWVVSGKFGVDSRNVNDYRQHLKVLRRLYDEGFRIFYFKRFSVKWCMFTDDFGTERVGCLEVHLMRVE